MTSETAPLSPPALLAAAPPARRRPNSWARRHVPLLVALAFAAILTALPLEGFKDRENYLNIFVNAPLLLLTNFDNGPLTFLSNEPLFSLLCLALNETIGADTGLRVLIFTGAFSVAYSLLKMHPGSAMLVLGFLLMPQVLKNHVVHLRQGLGLGLFLLGWSAASRWRWAPMLLAPFIHSSFFFVLLMLSASVVVKKYKWPKEAVVLLFVVLGICVGLALGELVRAAGARQGDEYEFVTSSTISGLGFLFWSGPLLLLLMEPRAFFRAHILEIGTLLFYLATYFLSPFTGRVFESTLLLILVAGTRMSRRNRLSFMGLVFSYATLQWVMILIGVNAVFSPES